MRFFPRMATPFAILLASPLAAAHAFLEADLAAARVGATQSRVDDYAPVFLAAGATLGLASANARARVGAGASRALLTLRGDGIGRVEENRYWILAEKTDLIGAGGRWGLGPAARLESLSRRSASGNQGFNELGRLGAGIGAFRSAGAATWELGALALLGSGQGTLVNSELSRGIRLALHREVGGARRVRWRWGAVAESSRAQFHSRETSWTEIRLEIGAVWR